MGNKKISELTEVTTPANEHLLGLVDLTEATAANRNKKLPLSKLYTWLKGLLLSAHNTWSGDQTFTGAVDILGEGYYQGTLLEDKFVQKSSTSPPPETPTQQGVTFPAPVQVGIYNNTAYAGASSPTINGLVRTVPQMAMAFTLPGADNHYQAAVVLDFTDPASAFYKLKTGATVATTSQALLPTLADTTEKFISAFVVRSDGPVVSPPEAKLYTGPGQNTDGPMHQKAATDELAKKLDKTDDKATNAEVLTGTNSAKFIVPSALASWWSSMRALAASWNGKQTFAGGINTGNNITKPASGAVKAVGINENGDLVAAAGDGTSLTSEANPTKAGTGNVLGYIDANGKFQRLTWSQIEALQRVLTLGTEAEPALLEIISTVSEITAADGKALSLMVNDADSVNPVSFVIQNKATGKVYFQVRYADGVQSIVAVENFEMDMLIDMLSKFRGARVETAATTKAYFQKPGTTTDVVLSLPDNGNFVEFEGRIVGTATDGTGIVSTKFNCLVRKEGGGVTVEALRGELPSSNWASKVTSYGLEADGTNTGAKMFITPAVSTAYDWKISDVYLTNNL